MTTTKRRPRTGLNALKARVKVRGLAAIDRRTVAARALLAWQDEVLAALGGEENISPQKRALVEVACRTKLYLDHLDGYILEMGGIVNKRRRSVYPILLQRQQLADSFARHLDKLGLERLPKPVPSLASYLEAKHGSDESRYDREE